MLKIVLSFFLQWKASNVRWSNGSVTKAYKSCDVDSPGVNNWLQTPFIDVKDLNTIYIKVSFTVRRCRITNPTSVQPCKESFNLYYHEAGRNYSTMTLDATSYFLVDKLTARHVYDSQDDLILNYETRAVSLNKNGTGIYFAFQDTGACITLMTVQVYYKLCQSITANYAHFASTPATAFNPVMVTGQCIRHAGAVTPPMSLCKSDGSWYFLNGGCTCEPGFEETDGSTCTRKVFSAFNSFSPDAIIRNRYNRISHPAVKTKLERETYN